MPTFAYPACAPGSKPAAPLPLSVVVAPVGAAGLRGEAANVLQESIVADLRAGRRFVFVRKAQGAFPAPDDAAVLRCKVGHWSQQRRYHGVWMLGGVLLAGVPFLLPLPFAHSQAAVEVEVKLEHLWPAHELYRARLSGRGRSPNFSFLWPDRKGEPRSTARAPGGVLGSPTRHGVQEG
jgi:hypothetical protein